MRIKLSDYILEQSISDASASDIALEQAKAEVEVTSAICEAYIKQFVMEADDENGKPQSSSGKSVSFIEKVKRFFISIGNWFRRMWIKFTGYLSEKKLSSKIKKLESLEENERRYFYGVLPFKDVDSIDPAINSFVQDTEKFKNAINKLMDENGEYTVRDLQTDLRDIKHNEYTEAEPADTPVRMNYDDYLAHLKSFYDEYIKHKTEIESITKNIKQNNFQSIADRMNTTDEKTLKESYKSIQKLYQMYSAKASRFMRVVMMYMKDAEKIEKNISENDFTQRDLDFLELMHLLAVALKKTDQFLYS